MSDWKARAEREAAAIIAEALPNGILNEYPTIVSLVAIGWIQGASFGAHMALEQVDDAFDELRASL